MLRAWYPKLEMVSSRGSRVVFIPFKTYPRVFLVRVTMWGYAKPRALTKIDNKNYANK